MLQFELRQPDLNHFFGARDNTVAACEIVDSVGALSVSLDVPGFRKEDIELEVKDRHLHVSGTRAAKTREESEKVLRQERRFGKFHRAFLLPEGIDDQNITAKFMDGVLEITIPKTAVVTRKILVN
jgi:HSP20 family protein